MGGKAVVEDENDDQAYKDYYNVEENYYLEGPGAGLLPNSMKKGPYKLFVTRVDIHLSTSGLYEIFSKPEIGIPINIYKKESLESSYKTTFALIEYGSMQEAQNAIREIHNREPLKLSVNMAESEEERAKRRRRKVEGALLNSHGKIPTDGHTSPGWFTNDLHVTSLHKQLSRWDKDEPAEKSKDEFLAKDDKTILCPGDKSFNKCVQTADTPLYSVHFFTVDHTSHLCQVCSLPALGCCNRCGTGYCSRLCQGSDWPEHKKACKTRSNYMSETTGNPIKFITCNQKLKKDINQQKVDDHGQFYDAMNLVDLNNASSIKLQLVSEDNIVSKKFTLKCVLKVHDTFQLACLHWSKSCCWFIIISDEFNFIMSLVNSIEFQTHCNSSPLIKPEKDFIVAAFSPTAGAWRRAHVMSDDSWTVFYIDYGWSEAVTKICVLPDQYRLPALAWCCEIKKLNSRILKKLEEAKTDLPCVVISIDENRLEADCNGCQIDLYSWATAVEEGLFESDSIITLKDLPVPTKLPFKCTVKFINSLKPDIGVIHLDEDLHDFNSLTEKLEIAYKNDSSSSYQACVQEVVICQYECKWFRGLVLENIDKQAVIHFIDYGHTERISYSEIRKMPSELISRVFGIEVMMDGVKDVEATKHFTTHIRDYCNKSYTLEIVSEDIYAVVKLFNGDIDLNEVISALSHPINEALISKLPLLTYKHCEMHNWTVGQTLDLTINELIDGLLSGVYARFEAGISELINGIQDHCKKAAMKIKYYAVGVNQLCFAFNPKTSQWNRACRLQLKQQDKFYFLDTGHYCAVGNNKLLPITEEFIEFPVYTIIGRPAEWVDDVSDNENKELMHHLVGRTHNIYISKIDPDYTPVFKFLEVK